MLPYSGSSHPLPQASTNSLSGSLNSPAPLASFSLSCSKFWICSLKSSTNTDRRLAFPFSTRFSLLPTRLTPSLSNHESEIRIRRSRSKSVGAANACASFNSPFYAPPLSHDSPKVKVKPFGCVRPSPHATFTFRAPSRAPSVVAVERFVFA